MIPYGRHSIDDSDIDAVVEVLRSSWLTQGQQVPKFENGLRSYCGADEAVAVNSATSALHLACLALGLGPDDWLWTSPITFVASPNSARYCGARVDFVDIDAETGNLSMDALEQKLARAEREGKLPRVLMPVHFAGQSCDMAAIHRLALRYGFRIIEDASHALGGRYQGKPVGCCQYSDITVFSFHPVKSMTSAEGGMALTNDPALAKRMRLLRGHGIRRDQEREVEFPDEPWRYQQQALGFNYRMSDLHAALGVSQLQRLDQFMLQRRERAERYLQQLSHLPLQPLSLLPSVESANHLFVVKLDLQRAVLSRSELFCKLHVQDVAVGVHYIPVHTQPYYREQGFQAGDFPIAEAFYQQVISLPLYPGLSDADQDRVVAVLGKLLKS